MKRMRIFLSVLLTLALLAPCLMANPPKKAVAAELTAEQILQQSGKAFVKAKSYCASLEMKFGMKLDGEDLQLTCTGAITASKELKKLKMNFKTDMSSNSTPEMNASQQNQTYFAKQGKKYYCYSKIKGEKWIKYPISKEEFLDLFEEPEMPVDNSIKWELSDGIVNGRDVWILTSLVTMEDIEEIMDEMLELNGSSVKKADIFSPDDEDTDDEDGDTEDEAEDLFESMKNHGVSVKYYVDKETMQPVRVAIDMKDFMESLYNTESKAETMSVEDAFIEITFDNINKAVNINVPAAAKKAKAIW